MFRRLGSLLAAFALFTIAGGHWAVLQSVAWAQMVRAYSQDASLSVAVGKTFSGKYPCSMCRNIAEGRKNEEQQPAAQPVLKKTESFTAATIACLPRRACEKFSYGPPIPAATVTRSDAPPQPIPIRA